ncbi:MAG: Asp-tRNA(Asn)/Glu-tRNA(Gln) amidotransferase subunit GatB [Acidimicrobiales bacterium]|nr:MAG: Asp-tRNA(Asn)/Glu-tRNA(Gln) amidotransferase subunit GatB [Acidimicrobiales bacterium]
MSVDASGDWEMVIGLEVHCELSTATKLFCSCRNAFGDEPNTNVCPVCLGLPGSLPVLNARAVELAMRVGSALHCEIRPSIFHRKNYFYPDMPKGYQVSQYDAPINLGGWLDLPGGERIRIERAHLEEDTGKTTHVGGGGRIHQASHSLVDYNRAGVPLVETVSAPDIRSADQARSYVSELRAVLVAVGASDGKMEEGSLRVDANVSVWMAGAPGAVLGTRCEIKNLNSLRSLGRAIEYESGRQVALLESGQAVVQETRHWNEADSRTTPMRSKEEAFDYRYFPEPDLVPLVPDQGWRDAVEAELPTLPAARRDRLAEVLSGGDGGGLAGDRPGVVDGGGDGWRQAVATLVELDLDGLVLAAVQAGADPRLAVNRAANEAAADPGAARRLDPGPFARLLAMEADGRLSATQAKAVLAEMLARSASPEATDPQATDPAVADPAAADPEAIARAKGYQALTAEVLASVVDEVLVNHPDEWGRYLSGDAKVSGFLMGQIMKSTHGRADGKAVAAVLRQRFASHVDGHQ